MTEYLIRRLLSADMILALLLLSFGGFCLLTYVIYRRMWRRLQRMIDEAEAGKADREGKAEKLPEADPLHEEPQPEAVRRRKNETEDR